MMFISEHIGPQFFGLLITIISGVYIYMKFVIYNYWRSRNINYNKHTVVPVGSLWPVFSQRSSLGEFLRDQYLETKKIPVFGIYSFHRPSLLINDPELIRTILTKEFSSFHDRGFFSNESVDPLSANLSALPGAEWKRLRNQFSPMFTSSKMKQMFFTVKECSETLMSCVENSIEGSKLIDVKELMARFTSDVMASAIFGIQGKCLENPEAEFRTYSRKACDSKPIRNTLAFLCPNVLKALKIKLNDSDVTDFIINVVKETTEYRTANDVTRRDFIDLIMQLINHGYIKENSGKESAPASVKDSHPDSNIDHERITLIEGAAQAFLFWQAGFETSSTAATHCLYELALHQDIQDKVSEEINTALEDFGGVTYESINKMPYLHKVLSETMRKYPGVPLLNRVCTKDIKLPGVECPIEKGTSIIIPVLGLHSDRDIYPEPEKFDPERFSEKNIAGRHQYTYLPFGEGPRNCMGMRFGLLQTKIGLLSLLSKFRFKPGPNLAVPLQLAKGSLITTAVADVTLYVEQR